MSTHDSQHSDEEAVCICMVDGHRFKFDDSVPDEVTELFDSLSQRNAKFSEIPTEYLRYEIEYDAWAETDNVIIDGHVFAVNYDVPADATAALIELAKRESVRYADVPAAYRQYEDPSSDWVQDPDFPASAITYVQDDSDEDIPYSESDQDEEDGEKESMVQEDKKNDK
ncbi:hypothetical protein P170DRAFT_463611 [Aspergillus steynii IBT 23096]|uniref:Uncharacterized protein n=1 Tax=Aspergillus steynii IBT 23096 TaxID=1392250 RepID=A0A2I2GBX9_9EURO|nr:uncharacterized protein P170DRAFT_463611 [Aspergillus steynii IBT 23096]PLB50394.1 hypothetical protein P170DRAFT_463611 [Aspergillus steynii IBT 23096]